MAEENTTLVSPVLPQLYQKQTWNLEQEKLNRFDKNKDGELKFGEKRRAKRWIQKDSHADRDKFDISQQTQFYRSMDAFIKAAQSKQALDAVQPVINNDTEDQARIAAEEQARLEAERQAAEAARRAEEEAKLAEARDVEDDGSPMTDEDKLSMLKKSQDMSNYVSELISKYGTQDVSDEGTLGSSNISNAGTTLQPIVTQEHLANHINFRNNRRGHKTVTIEGKTYPVFVTTGLKNNKLGLVDDWSYALDPDTGKVILLHESAEGDVVGTGQGSYKWDAKFKEGAKWIDISSLVGATAASQPVSLQLFSTSKYFRPHKNDIKSVTINGVSYPILVTLNLFGNDYGLKNDHTYAFDASTGRVKALHEGWFGNITKGGIHGHGAKWEDEDPDAGWVDLRTLPGFQKRGGIIKKQYFKQGGTMNRIKYFQQGGPAQQLGAQDVQKQVVALVQAAMQGDEKANQTVTQIMEAAKAGDPQATQLAQLIQLVVQQMKGQATAAKWGSKLNYIRSLKYAKGGKACPECEKGAPLKVEEKACGGKAKKAKKRYFGGWL